MQNKSVAAFWLKGILACAESQKVPKSAVFEEAGVATISELTTERVPLDATVKVWNAAINLTDDPLFGFHMGRQFRPNWFNLIHHLWANSPNVRSAIALTLKYQALISDGGELKLIDQGATAQIQYLPKADKLPFSFHQTDAVLAILVSLMRWSVDDGFSPLKISMQHDHQQHHQEYQRFFQCEIEYQASQPTIELERAWLDKTMIGADHELLKMHLALAEQKLSALGKDTLTNKISHLLIHVDQFQEINKTQMAERLNTSSRTLQRKLTLEQTTYTQIADQVRKSLAERLIAQNLSVTDLTHQLAFKEVSSLHKACKRWFKMSLSEYRVKSQNR
ncbi:AraC family transcriptional regulator [Litoribacillus peritrichatus]|uniref:HTH araC/xylS-type domain-containing protein n=1 Tax=Litoribacillus peritrichatus TaxID=718191 RepID=A0ABP7N973_9GAMM